MSKSNAVSPTGRPNLKNLSRARVPRAAFVAVSLATGAAVAWQVLVANKHKTQITEFYKNYDPERDYARMKAAGVFKSLESRERPEWLSQYEQELDSAIASLQKK